MGAELHAADLGDTVHDRGHTLAEPLADVRQRDRRVLDHVVNQTGHQGVGVEAEQAQDGRHRYRVADEFVSRRAPLARMSLSGQLVRIPHRIDVQPIRVRLHGPGQRTGQTSNRGESGGAGHPSATPAFTHLFPDIHHLGRGKELQGQAPEVKFGRDRSHTPSRPSGTRVPRETEGPHEIYAPIRFPRHRGHLDRALLHRRRISDWRTRSDHRLDGAQRRLSGGCRERLGRRRKPHSCRGPAL